MMKNVCCLTVRNKVGCNAINGGGGIAHTLVKIKKWKLVFKECAAHNIQAYNFSFIYIYNEWIMNPALKQRTQHFFYVLKMASINSDTTSVFKCKFTHYIVVQGADDKKERFHFSTCH